jgi:hypothetical protein
VSLPLIIAVAIVLVSLAIVGLRFRAVRRRRGLAPPVTEAEARAARDAADQQRPVRRPVVSRRRHRRPVGDPAVQLR